MADWGRNFSAGFAAGTQFGNNLVALFEDRADRKAAQEAMAAYQQQRQEILAPLALAESEAERLEAEAVAAPEGKKKAAIEKARQARTMADQAAFSAMPKLMDAGAGAMATAPGNKYLMRAMEPIMKADFESGRMMNSRLQRRSEQVQEKEMAGYEDSLSSADREDRQAHDLERDRLRREHEFAMQDRYDARANKENTRQRIGDGIRILEVAAQLPPGERAGLQRWIDSTGDFEGLAIEDIIPDTPDQMISDVAQGYAETAMLYRDRGDEEGAKKFDDLAHQAEAKARLEEFKKADEILANEEELSSIAQLPNSFQKAYSHFDAWVRRRARERGRQLEPRDYGAAEPGRMTPGME